MRERTEIATGASRTAAPRVAGRLNYRRGLIVATIAAFLMTLLGAFGTGDVPIMQRLPYWLVIMESGALIGIGASTGIRTWGALVDRPVLEGAAISLLIALPLTLVVLGVTMIFFGGQAPRFPSLVGAFVGVLVVTAVITAINYAKGTADALPGPESVESILLAQVAVDTEAQRPKLLDRLPQHLRHAALYALEAEDHYLRVHTSVGTDLILLRLSDAIEEIGSIDGARTHRSWWVARDAIRSIQRTDGRAVLTLMNGVQAPVSRSFAPMLRQRGWFL